MRIGTSGAHSAINLAKSTSGEIVGKLDSNSYKSEMKRISSEIPDPTFGYLRRSSTGYQKKTDALRINLSERDLSNVVYVDHYVKNDSEMTFLGRQSQFMRRYRMRYTRGWESSGGRWVKLSTLFIEKVAIQKDILEGKLGSIDIPNEDREEIRQELDLVENRWQSARRKNGIGKIERPLLTSTEWVRIQIRERTGWKDWQSMDRDKQWDIWLRLGFIP